MFKRVLAMLLVSFSSLASNQEPFPPDFKGNWKKGYKLSHTVFLAHTPQNVVLNAHDLHIETPELQLGDLTINDVRMALHLKADMSKEQFEHVMIREKLYPPQFFHTFAGL